MNFKIENRFIDITNYRLIEKHFEKMASLGWMIDKIIMGSLFIYKKIAPEELDFSISPYEVETAFTVKSKEELEEFQSVCESVGWNYAMKANDFYVYYKKTGTEVVDISTDEENEFNTLERIAKKQLVISYILIPVYIYLAWAILGGIFKDPQFLQDGMVQIQALVIPVFLLEIYHIIRIQKFLKLNRNNIELGEPLEYSNAKFYLVKATFLMVIIYLILFLSYSFYAVFVLNSKIILIAFAPLFIGLTIGIFYRTFIKPSKKTIKSKKVFLVHLLILSTIISISVSLLGINALAMDRNSHDIEEYKVLSVNDFKEKSHEDEGDLMRNSSFLIPTSYTYRSKLKGDFSVKTEYSNTLTKRVAENLVTRYIKQAEKSVENSISWEIKILIEKDIYDYSLEFNGITEEEFDSFKVKPFKEAEKEALKIAREKAITKDDKDLWDLDEVYFLNFNKTEVVIRKGKEVFYIDGLDFTDPKVIEIIKKRLDL